MAPSVNPEDDGVTHINVYSKASTRLGYLLSNFAHTPFYHPKHGRFASMEGFYYWLKTGKQHEHLKNLYGFKAKQEGKRFESVQIVYFEKTLTRAVMLKIIQTPELLSLLSKNTLPFYHYYVYGGTHVVDRTEQSEWLLKAIVKTQRLITCLI